MTLQEAVIRLNELHLRSDTRWKRAQTPRLQALQLGIEALNFRQRCEEQDGDDDFARLQGESDE
jgi:hypothetical protein